MSKPICVLIAILLLAFLTSCSKGSIDFLNNSICEAPCWRGIDMGTSKDNAIDLLRTMTDVDDASIQVTQVHRPFFEEELHWRFENSEEVGSMALNNNKVNQMYFPLKKQLTLSRLIELYGHPDALIIRKSKFEGTSIEVYFLYQNRDICLVHRPSVFLFSDPITYKINSNIHISEVYYADHTIDNWHVSLACGGGFEIDEYTSAIQEWKGYSDYQISPSR